MTQKDKVERIITIGWTTTDAIADKDGVEFLEKIAELIMDHFMEKGYEDPSVTMGPG